MIEPQAVRRESEDCKDCGDTMCRKHSALVEEARSIQSMRHDPQRNRIGVRGDPTPDHAYGGR